MIASDIREPKKSEGVPRQTPERNYIGPLTATLASAIPGISWNAIHDLLTARKFFEAALTEQERMVATTCLEVAGQKTKAELVIEALLRSDRQEIGGVADGITGLAFANDLPAFLQWTQTIAAGEGTWQRESAMVALHNVIIRHGAATIFRKVKPWLKDKREGVRRVVAEAFRPRGVWLPHITELKADPSMIKDVLTPLLDDPSDYVRKAVANNLNDISKDHPEIVLAWAKEWSAGSISSERTWIITRALRTLIKQSHPDAMEFMGFGSTASLRVSWDGAFPSKLSINQLLPFELEVINPSPENAGIVVLLHVDEPGKSAKPRRSVYQIWKGNIEGGTTQTLRKNIHFVHRNSKPKEAGEYRFTVLVNGNAIASRTALFKIP